MKPNEGLPDVSLWQPQPDRRDTLRNVEMMTCQVAQTRIVARAQAEANFNIQNFDSGPGVEDIVREEVSNLLPERYSVDAGVVNDRFGNTAGDCDMIIRNHHWFPVIKPGATAQSRRIHFPIEAVYACAEIKQTLGFKELDAAMQKLVTVSRLNRPDNPYGHITENQHLAFLDQDEAILNPLHTTVFATRLLDGLTFDDIASRFGAINALLGRRDMVTMLCVLNYGTAWYSVFTGSPYNADFMKDRREPIILQVNNGEPRNAFYRYHQLLMGHLTRAVLRLTDISSAYGAAPPHRKTIPYPDALFNHWPDDRS